MKKANYAQLAIAAGLMVTVVVLRVLPHPANFAPAAAAAIFGGAVLPRKLAVWTPVAAMAAADVFIGFYSTILITWGCYALIALASSRWLRTKSLKRGAALTLGSSLFFFFVTNFAVWLWGGMYAHNWSGLSQCYYMALPFFRNTALSDMVFTGALFSAYYGVIQLSRKLAAQAAAK